MSIATDDTLKIIEGIKIPPEPYILKKLNQLIQVDEPEIAEISRLVAKDVGISSLVLHTVNSAFFGMRTKVQSIPHAANLLGVNNIANIVTGLCLRQHLENNDDSDVPNFWESQSNTAMIGANISHSFTGINADEMYMIGLFHNAGHVLLTHHYADYGSLLKTHLNAEATVITDIEEEQYNTNHATLGYFLAISWGMDRTLANVIRDHHRTLERLKEANSEESSEQTMLAVLKMSEHIDNCFWGITDYEWMEIGQPVLEFLGLSTPDYEDIELDLLDKLRSG